jgi:hypothetical protein
MTLDHAGHPIRPGVSRGNGGNARPVACPGRCRSSFDPRSCPGAPRFRSLRPCPGRNWEWRRSRPGCGHSLPAGWPGCPGPPLAGSGPPSCVHCWGGKPGKAGAGWTVAAVSGGGRRRGAGRWRCPPWYRPQEAPRREQEQETERRRRVRGARAAVPGQPVTSRRIAVGESRPVPVAALTGTTTGRAADPILTADLSHPPEPAACSNRPFRFFSPVMGAVRGFGAR